MKEPQEPRQLPKELQEARCIEDDDRRFRVAYWLQRLVLAPTLYPFTRIINRTHFEGLENLEELKGKSFLVCPNHTSSFDIWMGFEIGFMALSHFWSTDYYLCGLGAVERLGPAPVRNFCLNAGVLPVDRNKGLEQYALQDIVRLFQERKKKIAGLVYPEGTRSKSGRLAKKYKAGVGWIQAMTNVPVVPVYQKGYNTLPGIGKKLHVVIDKPMYFEEFQQKKDLPGTWYAITKQIMDRLYAIEDRLHKGQDDDSTSLQSEVSPVAANHSVTEEGPGAGRVTSASKETIEEPSEGNSGETFPVASKDAQLALQDPDATCLIRETGNGDLELSLLKVGGVKVDLGALLLPKLSMDSLVSRTFANRFSGSRPIFCMPALGCPGALEQVLEASSKGFPSFVDLSFKVPDELASVVKALDGADQRGKAGFHFSYHPHFTQLLQSKVQSLIDTRIRTVSVSGFLNPTPELVLLKSGGVNRPTGDMSRLILGISTPGMLGPWLRPPRQELLQELTKKGLIREEQARILGEKPLMDGVIYESGESSLANAFSQMNEIRGQLGKEFLLGLSGTVYGPRDFRDALFAGFDFVVFRDHFLGLRGAGFHDGVSKALFEATTRDFGPFPDPDFFDMGINRSVYSRGSVIPGQARKLALYYHSLEEGQAIPDLIRKDLEDKIFQMPLQKATELAHEYFHEGRPGMVEAALHSSRSHLAMLSQWFLINARNRLILGDNFTHAYLPVDENLVRFYAWIQEQFPGSRPGELGLGEILDRFLKESLILGRLDLVRLHSNQIEKSSLSH